MTYNLILQHSATNPFECMRAIAALIGGGLLADFYPKLRFAILRAGVGWLPYWTERLGDHYRLMPEYLRFLKRKPSEVIRSENFFISCDSDEATLPYVVKAVGLEHILYASRLSALAVSRSNSACLPEFAPAEHRAILYDNQRRLHPRIDLDSETISNSKRPAVVIAT